MSLMQNRDNDKTSVMVQKVAVITGASRGIGLATAKLFYSKGYVVYDLSRSGSDTAWSKHFYCDVVDPTSIQNACESILNEVNRIDVLVVNAGYGISGSVEFTNLTDAKKQFDVNFFGAFNTAKTFLQQSKTMALAWMNKPKTVCLINILGGINPALHKVTVLVLLLLKRLQIC